MEHICRLEGEIIDHIQTIGEHRDSLKQLRAYYKRNGRAPGPADISKMIDAVKEQILADAMEYGDMDSADEGMSMTDSDGPVNVVNMFAQLRCKWSREEARREAAEMEDEGDEISEQVDEREHIATVMMETDAEADEGSSSTPSFEPTDLDSDSLEGSP